MAKTEKYGPFDEYKEVTTDNGSIVGLQPGETLTVKEGEVPVVEGGAVEEAEEEAEAPAEAVEEETPAAEEPAKRTRASKET